VQLHALHCASAVRAYLELADEREDVMALLVVEIMVGHRLGTYQRQAGAQPACGEWAGVVH